MKITVHAKIVADISNDPDLSPINEPTLDWLMKLINTGKCIYEMVPSWDSSAEPTIIITEKK